jgi:hypothetical protein
MSEVGSRFGAHTAGDEVLHVRQGSDISVGVTAVATGVMPGGPNAVTAMPAAQRRCRDTQEPDDRSRGPHSPICGLARVRTKGGSGAHGLIVADRDTTMNLGVSR